MTKSKVRMGMVGGGQGAFIGAVHRIAANLDGEIELVCGAFSSDPHRSASSGADLHLSKDRCYANFSQMLDAENKLPADQRMQFVAIVTPNHLHFPIAKAALEAGFHVMSDKPATLNLQQALDLAQIVKATGKLYGLTHTYNGYPMVKQAKHLISSGALGEITKVVVEYSQGWLANKADESGKQAQWRLDPARAGVSCCMGDIGVHAANLAEYVTNIPITAICADLGSVVPDRLLDDDGTILLRFDNNVRGVLLASQISLGDENNLRLRIYGEKASIDWSQLQPNTLWLKSNKAPAQQFRTGGDYNCAAAQAATRTPAGHPEGYLEAFANIYKNFAEQIRAYQRGEDSNDQLFDVPGIEQAIRGMAFIENAVNGSRSSQKWHDFSLVPATSLKE